MEPKLQIAVQVQSRLKQNRVWGSGQKQSTQSMILLQICG